MLGHVMGAVQHRAIIGPGAARLHKWKKTRHADMVDRVAMAGWQDRMVAEWQCEYGLLDIYFSGDAVFAL